MNTGDNIYYTLSSNDGFVFSQTAKGANEEVKNYIIDEKDYKWKECLYPTEIGLLENIALLR